MWLNFPNVWGHRHWISRRISADVPLKTLKQLWCPATHMWGSGGRHVCLWLCGVRNTACCFLSVQGGVGTVTVKLLPTIQVKHEGNPWCLSALSNARLCGCFSVIPAACRRNAYCVYDHIINASLLVDHRIYTPLTCSLYLFILFTG